jgi:hypothetical protein
MVKVNKKRFIPEQVSKVESLMTMLFALQHQKNRIRQYADELKEFDSWPINTSIYQSVSRREAIQIKHDKHVGIYRAILDHYSTTIIAMQASTIMHSCGAHPFQPTTVFNLAPSYVANKATA